LLLCDVNVFVYAHHKDSHAHAACRAWLEALVNGDEAYGVSELVLSGFVRIVTHPRVFARPSPLADALAFTAQLRNRANAVAIAPGPDVSRPPSARAPSSATGTPATRCR